MKNLIYQYWDGEIPAGCKVGQQNMEDYARRIGADYLFEDNPRFVTNMKRYAAVYGCFKPIYDESFHDYDNVLYADMDIFAVDGLKENIFEDFTAEIGICTEPCQPKHRAQLTGKISGVRDEKWARAVKRRWKVEMPRTGEGLLKVYNAGLTLYSNKGLLKAREKFIPFKKYMRYMKWKGLRSIYLSDQNYLHTMLFVANMDYVELDNGWNSYVHWYFDSENKKHLNDMRTESTKFVHIQLRGADAFDAGTLWKITNLPAREWELEQ